MAKPPERHSRPNVQIIAKQQQNDNGWCLTSPDVPSKKLPGQCRNALLSYLDVAVAMNSA
jgi:hypothetical protein